MFACFHGTQCGSASLPQLVLSFFVFFYYSASFEVDVNCWWNQALHVDPNVSVVCHTSAQGRANSCDLCQIYVITPGQRHLLPSTCASTKETLNFSIATKHTGHIRCVCNGNMVDTCNVTVREGCEYHRIDNLSLMTFGNVPGFISFTYKCLCLHDTHTRIPEGNCLLRKTI